ncbi:MAG: hypothetical protein JXB49_01285 [Bacteroidales bacterium]|nr:hypothetical protein [Bacteroidales bacterium]
MLYINYNQVPFYRKQSFFWLMYFLFCPIALGILLSGDVYYKKKGEVKSFGTANKIIAVIIAIFIMLPIINATLKSTGVIDAASGVSDLAVMATLLLIALVMVVIARVRK